MKEKLQKILDTIIPEIINEDNYELVLGKLGDAKTLVVEIKVNPKKVGVLLGKRDEYGANPTKQALYRIIKQIIFYQGFTELVLTIGELKGENNGTGETKGQE